MLITSSSENPGKAPGAVESIKKKHRDLVEIDYKRLGELSDYMMKVVHDKARRIEISKPNLKKLLIEYKEGNKIILDEMNTDLRGKLNW